jgi:hypothetical protein
MRPGYPADLSPQDRIRELARLLAAGLLRLARPLPGPERGHPPAPEKPLEKRPELP